ncbi:hypothetical protein FJY71_02175, partial [candidate division WOR-3 bacterium]|nr:hypothetical protein [candidate division WOR-3 bacterium]
MRRFLLAALCAAFVAVAAPVSPSAELQPGDNVPMFINYQGYLTDTLGTPLSGTMAMAFAIFTDSSGGTQLWSQAMNVTVRLGVFNVKLALTPGDTSIFRDGNRRWLELRVNGTILSPRTEVTSMAYGIHALKADNSDMVDGRHANELIWNTATMQANSGFYVSYNGWAGRQLVAEGTGLPGNSAAVMGLAGAASHGVYGASVGRNGVFGYSEDDSAFGVCGYNTNARGSGVVASGCADTMVYLADGSGGAFSAPHIGLFGYGGNSDGTGVGATGNDLDSIYAIVGGSGGAFNGAGIGVYGLARNRTGNRCGGYFTVFGPNNETCFAYVAYRYNNTSYKILGYGQVSTVMPTRAGERILFAPESPEPVFEDYGEG